MEREDPWLAPDKVYHVLFCFSLTLFFSTLASLTRYQFIRHHAIGLGSIGSLLVGAAKEAADELGYFRSAGASVKDAFADVIGVLIASFVLSVFSCSPRADPETGQMFGLNWEPRQRSLNSYMSLANTISLREMLNFLYEEYYTWMKDEGGK